MPSGAKQVSKPSHITKGDIFDDLGLSPKEALEAKVKSDIWRDLLAHIEKRALSQAALAHTLKIHQPDVSNLLQGKLSKFSTAKLIQLAVRLDLGIQVKLTESKKPSKSVAAPTSAKGKVKVARAVV
jgi:predicted XRE-type DNA-binding protein